MNDKYKISFDDLSLLPMNESLDTPLSMDILLGYEPVISEGIFKTYPIETTLKYIKNLFNIDSPQIYIIDGQGENRSVKKIVINYPRNKKTKEDVEKAFLLCGYEPSRTIYLPRQISQSFRPLHVDDVSEMVRTKYKHIFHLTPSYNKDKILNVGFTPKSKNPIYQYSDRVFFFKGDTPLKEIEFQAYEFDKGNKSKWNNHMYTLFRIDTGRIGENVKFELDPNYFMGISTKQNLPPSVISGCFDFKANDDISFKEV